MYSLDTLERMHDELHQKRQEAVQAGKLKVKCDYCDAKATTIVPIYNPVDSIRNVEGLYCEAAYCDNCEEYFLNDENYFECDGCYKYFIINHSWDSLAATLPDIGIYCHKCALKELLPIPIKEVLDNIEKEISGTFIRLNVPESATVIWEGEYSGFSDFSGHTSYASLIRDIQETCKENNISLDTKVYAVVDHTYQFSISLSLFTL